MPPPNQRRCVRSFRRLITAEHTSPTDRYFSRNTRLDLVTLLVEDGDLRPDTHPDRSGLAYCGRHGIRRDAAALRRTVTVLQNHSELTLHCLNRAGGHWSPACK